MELSAEAMLGPEWGACIQQRPAAGAPGDQSEPSPGNELPSSAEP